MISEVIAQLKTDTDYWNSRVYEGYPPQFNILPVVSVSLLNNKDIAQGDGKGLNVLKGTISVDVWTKDRVEEISAKVISLLYALNGYIRLTAQNTLQEPGGVKHINFNFDVKLEV
jgi:hypothetical protein